MPNSPMTRYERALVVFEGPARITWRSGLHGQWTPTGIWPGPRERPRLAEHLRQGDPLLVILDNPCTSVPLLHEELARAPEPVRATLLPDHTATPDRPAPEETGTRETDARETSTRETDAGDGITEVRVPFLDWLPQPLRERGAAFLTESEQILAHTPLALLPPLLTEQPPTDTALQLRFARRLLPGAVTHTRLSAAMRHLFPSATRGSETRQPPGAMPAGCSSPAGNPEPAGTAGCAGPGTTQAPARQERAR